MFDTRRVPVSKHLGDFLIDGVQDLDTRCCKVVNGMECGLYNVREQFAADALIATGKKLTEELLISWMLQRRLLDAPAVPKLQRERKRQ